MGGTPLAVVPDVAGMPLDLARRIALLPQQWRVVVEHVEETDGSVLLFGTRGHQPVVIKIVRDAPKQDAQKRAKALADLEAHLALLERDLAKVTR